MECALHFIKFNFHPGVPETLGVLRIFIAEQLDVSHLDVCGRQIRQILPPAGRGVLRQRFVPRLVIRPQIGRPCVHVTLVVPHQVARHLAQLLVHAGAVVKHRVDQNLTRGSGIGTGYTPALLVKKSLAELRRDTTSRALPRHGDRRRSASAPGLHPAREPAVSLNRVVEGVGEREPVLDAENGDAESAYDPRAGHGFVRAVGASHDPTAAVEIQQRRRGGFVLSALVGGRVEGADALHFRGYDARPGRSWGAHMLVDLADFLGRVNG
mmetsp:Transcript_54027/g.65218  ORF Transcript_54027/g.65218 Transcript_54027/m.65218 type:complete len:268 (-) Transcript_54027:235-1038(-)